MRRKIFASAEILAERVRVQSAKKYTRTTEYDFNYEFIRARARGFREEDIGRELHEISFEFKKAHSTFWA